jgi:CRISPR-associated protein Cmr6
MMEEACRKAISTLWEQKNSPYWSNAGLVLGRYLRVAVKQDGHKDARRDLFSSILSSVQNTKNLYNAAFYRHKTALNASATGYLRTKVGIRMVIGLGGENVLEPGLALHPLYGTPYIPGTALKGLASHYCDQVWGKSDDRFRRDKKQYHATFFGTGDDSGHIIFHDAWIHPDTLNTSLNRDIMTPHHTGYYMKDEAPTDFDDPIPISFLSISGTFHIALSCDAPDPGGKWTGLAFRILSEALEHWGIGGKTSAGYGRMIQDNNPALKKLADQAQTASEGEKGPVQYKSSGTNPPPVTVNGKPITISEKPGGTTPLYKKGQVITVTRAPDPRPRPGRERFYFRAADAFGGFVKPGTVPDIAIGQTIELEITGLLLEGGYDFALPGAQRAFQLARQDTSRQQR